MIDPAARVLVPNDLVWEELVELGEQHSVEVLGRESGCYGVLLRDYPLPPDVYVAQPNGGEPVKPGCVNILLRIPEAYPHATPDMFWVLPVVNLAKTGARPAAAEQMENYHGRTWQRFSWHIAGGKWRPVEDTLAQTFVPFIERRLWRGS